MAKNVANPPRISRETFDPRSDILKYRSSAEPCLSIRSCISPPGVMGVAYILFGARGPTLRFRQLRSALLGAVVLVAVLLGAVSPAAAHDTAESTSPAAGATVAAPPEQVSVTFNHNPLALGSQIVVYDAAGANWSDGPVEIVDNVAAQKLKSGAPAGPYTVHWRVASSDGHPIEGSFTFTATAAAAGTTAAAAVPTMGTAQPGT